MNVLGINAVFHESSAALLNDGKVVAACEEERFNRVKHAKQSRVDNPHELPEQAIRFCLDHAGLQASEIDRVAYSFDPQLRRAEYRADWWPDSQMEVKFLRCLGEVGGATDRILRRKLGRALKFVSHHLAHAASAYYPSGFDAAAILIIGGIGEAACSTLARGEVHFRTPWHLFGSMPAFISASRPTMPPRSWDLQLTAIPMCIGANWRRSFK
jgi:carbamoyltransferase